MFHKNIVLLFIVTLIVTLVAYTTHAQDKRMAIPTEGLVAYWTLDEIKRNPLNQEIIEDIVGDNDGVLQDEQKVVQGKFGNALQFDGIQDFIIMDAHKLPMGNSAMSVSVWVFKDNKGTVGGHAIMGIGVNDCCQVGFGLSTFNGMRRLNNQIRTGQFPRGELHGPEIVLKQWNHIASVYDPAAKKNLLYLNGVEGATKDLDFEADIQPGPIPGKLGDGATLGGGTRKEPSWDGLIDEVGVYNRALTPADVQRIFNVNDIFAVEPLGKLSLVWGALKAAR